MILLFSIQSLDITEYHNPLRNLCHEANKSCGIVAERSVKKVQSHSSVPKQGVCPTRTWLPYRKSLSKCYANAAASYHAVHNKLRRRHLKMKDPPDRWIVMTITAPNVSWTGQAKSTTHAVSKELWIKFRFIVCAFCVSTIDSQHDFRQQ